MSRRYFSLDQAQGLLPEVTRLVRAARESRDHMEQGGLALARLIGRIELMGGIDLDPAHEARLMRERRNALHELKDTMESLELLGVEVTDLEAGTVDFPTRYRGGDACLTWRLGEHQIRFWRPAGESHRVRNEINPEFLSSHTGGPVH